MNYDYGDFEILNFSEGEPEGEWSKPFHYVILKIVDLKMFGKYDFLLFK